MNFINRISSSALVALLCSSGASLADPAEDLLAFSPIEQKNLRNGVVPQAELGLDGCILSVTSIETNSDGMVAYAKVSSIDLAGVDSSRISSTGYYMILWNADGSNPNCENIVGDACSGDPAPYFSVPMPGDMLQVSKQLKFRMALKKLVAECQ